MDWRRRRCLSRCLKPLFSRISLNTKIT